MSMRRIFFCILLVTTASLPGCNDLSDPVVNINESLLVVDGWLYNTPGPHQVKISRSVAFENVRNFEEVTDARVAVIVNGTDRKELTQVSPGIYETEPGFAGEPGAAYHLEISTPDGSQYRSEREVMKPVPVLDTVFFERLFPENEPELPADIVYFPVAVIREFESDDDFYRWRLSRNSIPFSSAEDIILQSDRFINGQLIRNEFKSYAYNLEDSVEIRLESLTEEAYNFLRFFRRQTTDLGTNAGTNPGTLDGNLSNVDQPGEVVLGYFGVSALSEGTGVVLE